MAKKKGGKKKSRRLDLDGLPSSAPPPSTKELILAHQIAAAEKAAKEAAEKEAKLAASRPPILITEPAEEDNFEEPDSSFDDYVNVPAAPIIRGEIESEKKKTVVTSPTQSPVEHVDLFGYGKFYVFV